MAATLLLARHGETEWNVERRWQGHAESDLTEAGRAQAIELAARVADMGVSSIYSSDLRRAADTAAIVGQELGLAVQLDASLREVDVGEWSGLTSPEIEARFPAGAARRRAGRTGWDQGETIEAMAARILAALVAIDRRHHGQTVLVVTHGGPIREMRRAGGAAGADWQRVPNCALDEFAVRDGGIRWLHSARGGLHQQVQG
jgi:broad specificity phosphatase PhoE